MTKKLEDLFINLDFQLERLGKCDSSVEYASHIREEFDLVVHFINKIKFELGIKEKHEDEYFD